VRVPGHRLQGHGAPYTSRSCHHWPCDTLSGVLRVDKYGRESSRGIGGHGHALCECSWTGNHLLTGADRRRDHQGHKKQIRAAQGA
jgi:hypothetical protein